MVDRPTLERSTVKVEVWTSWANCGCVLDPNMEGGDLLKAVIDELTKHYSEIPQEYRSTARISWEIEPPQNDEDFTQAYLAIWYERPETDMEYKQRIARLMNAAQLRMKHENEGVASARAKYEEYRKQVENLRYLGMKRHA